MNPGYDPAMHQVRDIVCYIWCLSIVFTHRLRCMMWALNAGDAIAKRSAEKIPTPCGKGSAYMRRKCKFGGVGCILHSKYSGYIAGPSDRGAGVMGIFSHRRIFHHTHFFTKG
jgi:hypothetical protein